MLSYFYFRTPTLTHVYPRIAATLDIRSLNIAPSPVPFGSPERFVTHDNMTYARFEVGHDERGKSDALIAIDTARNPEKITVPAWVAEVPGGHPSTPCVLEETIRCWDQSLDLSTGARTPTETLEYDQGPRGYIDLSVPNWRVACQNCLERNSSQTAR